MSIPPSLPRDPTLSDRFDPRTRRFLDLASAMFNSLIRDGLIVQTGAGSWVIPADNDGDILAGQVFGG